MSIQNELNQIKSAVYGADIRDAIHDSIKKTYDDASANGNANMEVEMARGTEPTLNDRLGKMDDKDAEVTAQLAQKAKKFWVNVMEHGVKGDGTDETQKILEAYSICAPGGTLYFPTPPVKYRMTQTFIIDKPIKIKGSKSLYEFEQGQERANILEFGNIVKTGIRNDVYNVNIEDITILMTSITSDTIAGIHLNGLTGGQSRHNTIKNVEIVFGHIYGVGVKGHGVLVTYLDNVHTWQGEYGFYFDGLLNTSINFTNTWARNQTKSGYYLERALYCSFTNTTSDSLNSPEHGYMFKNSSGISFHGGAAEHVTKSYLSFDNTKEVTVTGFIGVFGNKDGTGTSLSSFAQLINGSKHINFMGCRDYDSDTLNTNCIYVDSTSYVPIMSNCEFITGINNNGTVILPLDPTLQYTEFNIGVGKFIDNPKGSQVTLYDGRTALGTREKRLGVMNNGLTDWTGYINGDGSFFIGSIDVLPTPSATHRGRLRRRIAQGTNGDELYLCVLNADGSYSWKKVDLI